MISNMIKLIILSFAAAAALAAPQLDFRTPDNRPRIQVQEEQELYERDGMHFLLRHRVRREEEMPVVQEALEFLAKDDEYDDFEREGRIFTSGGSLNLNS